MLSVASAAQTETIMDTTDTTEGIMVRNPNPLVQTEFVHQPAEDLRQDTFAAEMQEDLPFHLQHLISTSLLLPARSEMSGSSRSSSMVLSTEASSAPTDNAGRGTLTASPAGSTTPPRSTTRAIQNSASTLGRYVSKLNLLDCKEKTMPIPGGNPEEGGVRQCLRLRRISH